MATYDDFEKVKDRNYGTEHYYRLQPFGDSFVYTDGIKDLVETFECLWLVTDTAAYWPLIRDIYRRREQEFCSSLLDVILDVKDSKAEYSIVGYSYDDKKDEEVPIPLITHHYSFTDMPDGKYKLFLSPEGNRGVLFLTSEY